jgi:hypothetical protein
LNFATWYLQHPKHLLTTWSGITTRTEKNRIEIHITPAAPGVKIKEGTTNNYYVFAMFIFLEPR